jgi:hypothetical protein
VYAFRAAYQSIALLDTEHRATLDAVTRYALRAHTLATEDTGAARFVELTRHAIHSWRVWHGWAIAAASTWHRPRKSCDT